ncbi:50S ribosomal protein L34 protein [Thalictrum thalictroides]|uniref:Large ribosomal subunit protein bL34c n=1 Tax=Thalictrum thalictroides TaxID=46969 RepID=A0A7J6WQM3_THATH|nr:50S ribosomal protein L34 protein [Thalictrum thalictroides]
MAISLVSLSTTANICSRAPSASLTFLTRTTTTPSTLKLTTNTCSGLLHCSFVPSSSTSLSFPSSFSGVSLGINFNLNNGITRKRSGLVVRAGKAALCLTKRNRSRKSLARTHGFRRRMRTTGGRAILKRRRAKGRKVLCTKSYPSSGVMS